MTKPVYDRKEQFRQIQGALLPGEEIIAVYDAIGAGTGFAITSIPYSKITSVSVVSNRSWAGDFFSTGSIAINVGTHTYEVDFRGTDKAHHVHNVILYYISS